MARKRGGLAGIWDRNKGVIRTLAPAALSFVPGIGVPLAAAAGAAMRGLDRPGQRGIGLNPYAAIRGGLEGAAIGAGTQAIAGGVKGLLTGGARGAAPAMPAGGAGAAPAGAPNFQVTFDGIGAPLNSVSPADALRPVNMGTQLTTSAARRALPGIGTPTATAQGIRAGAQRAGPSMLSRIGSFARENKDLIGMAGKGIMSTMPQPGEEAAMMNAETARMRFEEERRQMQMEEERRRRIAELLMPFASEYYPQYFSGR